MLRFIAIVVGFVSIMIAVGLAITAPTTDPMNGLNYVLLTLFPQAVVIAAWRLMIIPILFVIGNYLITSALTPRRWFIWLVLGWSIAYLIYMIILVKTGHRMLIQGFDFHQGIDLVYLFLNSAYVGILLKLFLSPHSQADIYGTAIGFISQLALSAIAFWRGPTGFLEGELLQVITFITEIPVVLLIILGLIATFINLIRLLWREIRWHSFQSKGEAT
jgi:hypothetical protein